MEKKFDSKKVIQMDVNSFKIKSLLLFIFFFGITAHAQIKLTGKITDDNNLPLPGATVLIKGTNFSATSDIDGMYNILGQSKKDELIVSYVGFKTISRIVGNDLVLNFSLKSEESKLNEVVVVGYGSQKKSDITTSVSSIKGADLANEKTTSITEALTGKLAGVQIRQTSGEPGSNISIKIRGTSSITAGGNPLYVVDGVPLSNQTGALSSIAGSRNNFVEQPTNPLSSLNPDDIESIEVLKDASSAAIYGSRGSNGVILITTKRGKSGVPQVSYSTSLGVSSVLKKIDMLDAYDYAKLHVEAKNTAYLAKIAGASILDDNATRIAKGGSKYQIPQELLPYIANVPGLTNTDWQDQIFRSAVTKSHTLSIGGGNDNTKYFTSLNYFNQEGTVIGSQLERFSLRLNLDGNLSKKIKYGVKLNSSRINQDLVSTNGPIWNEGVVASALAQAPIFPVTNQDGTYNIGLLDWSSQHRNISGDFVVNPVAVANQVKDKMITNRLIGNGYLDYEIIPNLNYKVSFGSEINDIRRDFYRPQSFETINFIRANPDAITLNTNTANWLAENMLSYKKSFGDHNLNLLGGYSAQMEDIKLTQASGKGFSNDLVTTINGALTTSSLTREEQWSLLSYLFRAQYNFKSKYFFSAAIRRDGSSRFGETNKWGNFPSASVGWRVSKEKFLENSKIINELKLRASYGVTGNFQIPNYGSISLVGQNQYVTGIDNLTTGLSQITSVNKNLSWETTGTMDFGINTSLFDGLVTIDADYYNSNTSDLLLNVNVPQISGFATQLQNIGKVNNKGFEISLGTEKEFGNFSWKSSVNFSKNQNTVIALGTNGDPIYANSGRGQSFITQIGQPIGSYYGYVVDGIYNTQEEISAYLPAGSGTTKPGDFKFRDLNKDGKITIADRQIIGSYQPDFTYGFSTSLKYKNLDFGFALQGVQGNQVLNTLKNYTGIPTGGLNTLASVVNRWKSPTDQGDGHTPRANFETTGNNNQISTYYVEDGSYLKVQNITLGYNFSKDSLKKIGLQTMRVSISSQNPFIFTKYTGYNPEVSSNPANQLGQGEDFGTYPISKTFTMSLDVKF